MTLEGKVAVIYAGARGIGKAYCEALLQKGCKVCIGDILIMEGSQTVQEFNSKYKDGELVFFKCDVLIDSDVKDLLKKAIDTYGQIDIVVANAGIVDEKDWAKCMELNLGGVMRVFYTAIELMSKDNGGRGGDFVATASILGLMPSPVAPAYAAAKHGIVGFIRSWGTELNYSTTQVKCNCICPSFTDTKMLVSNQLQFYSKEHYDVNRDFKRNLQLLSPDEVAKCLINILENGTANGQCVVVNKEGCSYFNFTEPTL